MQIFIKTLDGSSITLDVSETDTVRSVKQQIHERRGTPIDQQRLICSGKQLENESTLSDYAIVDQATIHLVLRLKGGN